MVYLFISRDLVQHLEVAHRIGGKHINIIVNPSCVCCLLSFHVWAILLCFFVPCQSHGLHVFQHIILVLEETEHSLKQTSRGRGSHEFKALKTAFTQPQLFRIACPLLCHLMYATDSIRSVYPFNGLARGTSGTNLEDASSYPCENTNPQPNRNNYLAARVMTGHAKTVHIIYRRY